MGVHMKGSSQGMMSSQLHMPAIKSNISNNILLFIFPKS